MEDQAERIVISLFAQGRILSDAVVDPSRSAKEQEAQARAANAYYLAGMTIMGAYPGLYNRLIDHDDAKALRSFGRKWRV